MLRRWLVVAVLFAGCAYPPARKSTAVGVPPEIPAPPEVDLPTPAASHETRPRVDFARQVRPILEARCQPCHFPGGRMYEALPFDREETVHHLGEKLFTRIKAEDEQRVIGALLSQGR
jgi:hypothetical protein